DMAQPLRAPALRARRDSLYSRAERDARRAVRLAPNAAPALFSLGLVLGNRALTRGIKERIRMAGEIRGLALRALAADSAHARAQLERILRLPDRFAADTSYRREAGELLAKLHKRPQ